MNRREVVRLGLAIAVSVPALACKKPALTCVDETGLSKDEQFARHVVTYVDVSTEAGKDCSNCSQYVKPGGDACAGCKLIKGPVHPRGYCKVYAPVA